MRRLMRGVRSGWGGSATAYRERCSGMVALHGVHGGSPFPPHVRADPRSCFTGVKYIGRAAIARAKNDPTHLAGRCASWRPGPDRAAPCRSGSPLNMPCETCHRGDASLRRTRHGTSRCQVWPGTSGQELQAKNFRPRTPGQKLQGCRCRYLDTVGLPPLKLHGRKEAPGTTRRQGAWDDASMEGCRSAGPFVVPGLHRRRAYGPLRDRGRGNARWI